MYSSLFCILRILDFVAHWSLFCILGCIEVYFAAGDRFLTETNISQANPATTIHFGEKTLQDVLLRESSVLVGQVDVFGVVLMNSRVGKEQVTVAMAVLISKQRETYKPITCRSPTTVAQYYSFLWTDVSVQSGWKDT